MTPDEISLLERAGSAFNHNTIQILCMTAFYGVYLIIFPYAVVILCRRREKTITTISMLVVTCLMFAITTLSWAGMISQALVLIQTFLMKNMDLPLATRAQLANAATIPSLIVETWPQYLNFVLGDAIVVWRVWALWPEGRVIRWGLVFLLIANAAMSISASVLQTIIVDPRAFLNTVQVDVQLTSYALSLAINVVSTILIGYKAWAHRQLIRECYGKAHQSTRATKILYLLIESGAIYVTIQLIYIVLSIINTDPNGAVGFAERVVNSCAIIIAAIYPTLIIIMVALQQSIVDTSGISNGEVPGGGNSTRAISALHFASPDTSQTVTNHDSPIHLDPKTSSPEKV